MTRCTILTLWLIMSVGVVAVSSQSPHTALTELGDVTTALETHRVPLIAIVVTRDGVSYRLTQHRDGRTVPAAVDDEDRAPIFEAASLGKVVTAYLVCILADRGIVSLDEPVFPYLESEWTADDSVRDVTLRTLLSHTAGYGNSVVPLDRTIYDPPGTHFRYSGVGYVAVMRMLEYKTGRPFEALADEHVFTPLGMTSSSFVTDRSIVARKVAPHVNTTTALAAVVIPAVAIFTACAIVAGLIVRVTRRRRTLRSLFVPLLIGTALLETALFLVTAPRFLWINVAVWGATLACVIATRHLLRRTWIGIAVIATSIAATALFAGEAQVPLMAEAVTKPNAAYTFHTTSSDLSRFAEILLADIGESYLRPMVTPQIRVDTHMSWGSGLGIEEHAGRTVYWHWGSNMGFKSLLIIDPAAGTTSVMLTNGDNGLEVARHVARTMHGAAFRFRLPDE